MRIQYVRDRMRGAAHTGAIVVGVFMLLAGWLAPMARAATPSYTFADIGSIATVGPVVGVADDGTVATEFGAWRNGSYIPGPESATSMDGYNTSISPSGLVSGVSGLSLCGTQCDYTWNPVSGSVTTYPPQNCEDPLGGVLDSANEFGLQIYYEGSNNLPGCTGDNSEVAAIIPAPGGTPTPVPQLSNIRALQPGFALGPGPGTSGITTLLNRSSNTTATFPTLSFGVTGNNLSESLASDGAFLAYNSANGAPEYVSPTGTISSLPAAEGTTESLNSINNSLAIVGSDDQGGVMWPSPTSAPVELNDLSAVPSGYSIASADYIGNRGDIAGTDDPPGADSNVDDYVLSVGSSLTASIALTNADGSPFTGSGSGVGSTLKATVTLSNTSTSQPITGLSVNPALSVSPASSLTLVSGPTPAPPTTLSPGQSAQYVMTYKIAATGTATLSVTPSGTEGESTVSATASAVAHLGQPLDVSVEWLQNGVPVSFASPGQPPQPDTIRLTDSGGRPVPQNVTAQVTVTNTGAAAEQNVSINGTPVLSYHNPAAGVGVVPATVIGGPTPSGTLPNLPSGASTTVSYTVQVTGEGVFDFSVQVLSSDAGTQNTNVSDGVGTLTVLGAALKIDWSMPPRVAKSLEDLSDTETTRGLPPASFVTPDSWTVNLHMVDGTTPVMLCPAGVSYSWVVTPPPGAEVTAQPQDGCSTTMSVSALGNYTVTATRLDDTTGGFEPTSAPPLQQTVAVKDLLVVGLGDSNASGEGLPPFYYTPCNRGVASYLYQAAAALEQRVQPHTSVTFVSAACSGATSQNLVDHTYAGINGDTVLPAQIGSVEQLLSEHGSAPQRSVDAAMVSIGINNIGFGSLLEYCVKHPPVLAVGDEPCFQQTVRRSVDDSGGVTWTHAGTGPTLDKGVRGLIAALPQRYDEVANALTGLVPANRVYLSQYPNETTDDKGNLCSGYNSALVQSVWGWLSSTGTLLNNAGAAGAAAHGWHTIVVPPEAFSGHGYCASDPWFVSLSAAHAAGNMHGAFHANVLGAAVTARVALADICPVLAPDPTVCSGTSATPPDGPTGSDGVVSAGDLAPSNGTTASLPVEASCSTAQSSSCSVSSSATGTRPSPAADAAAARGGHRHGHAATVIARGRFKLAAGSSLPLTLRLTRAGRTELHARRSLRIVVTVLITGHHRATLRRTFTLRLRLVHPPRPRPTRRSR